MNKFLLPLVCLLPLTLGAQKPLLVERYIDSAFQQNQGLQQQVFELEKNIYALKAAKTLFLPTTTLMGDYFLAGGGRTVDFPAGDLLNPVYSTLNQLTNSTQFPVLENQNILLNPDNFYDAKLRTTLPLFNLDIAYNRRIRSDQVILQQLEIDVYKRELAKDVKTAYLGYLQSLEAVAIYENALKLIAENERINAVLFANGQVNRTVVLRAQNERTKYEALREDARQTSFSAQAYFNFLLNRPLDAPIERDSGYLDEPTVQPDAANVAQREELEQLRLSQSINRHRTSMAKAATLPKLSTFLDLGSQGFDGQFNDDTRYYFFGISLQWELFAFGRNHAAVKSAMLDQRIAESATNDLSKQLELQLAVSTNAFNAALYRYRAERSTNATALKAYSDVLRLYQEGQVNYIELLDVQNQLIQSELQRNVALFDTYIKAAEIERAAASFTLNTL